MANGKTHGGERPKTCDPNCCATSRCKGEPALAYLGRPLCQKCWDQHCAEEPASAMITEGEVPLAEGLNTSPVAAANEASRERALPGPEDGVNEEVEDAGNAPANTGDAGELDTEDIATKTKKSALKKGKARKTEAKAPAASQRTAAVGAATAQATGNKSAKGKPARKTVPSNGDAKAKRVSAIDAAAVILKDKGEPMRSREINTKGADARFTLKGRGLFGFNANKSV